MDPVYIYTHQQTQIKEEENISTKQCQKPYMTQLFKWVKVKGRP